MPANKKVRKSWKSVRIHEDVYNKILQKSDQTGISISRITDKLFDDQTAFQERLAKIEDFLRRIGHMELVWTDTEGQTQKAIFKNVVDKLLNEQKT